MKKLFITGGSQGIGKATVEEYRRHGYEIIAPPIEEMDLRDNRSVDEYIAEHKNETFDVVVNNAGINELDFVEDITDENIDAMIKINLEAPIRLLRGFVPQMKKNGSGRIINISSVWGIVSKEKRLLYSVTKNGIHGITNTLAVELAPFHILVNTVCPGFTLTELTRKNLSPKEIEAISQDIPLQRMAEPTEIAKLIYFLGSEENTYITGQKIAVDGGYTSK